jgi:hypothetical protein
VVPPFIPSKARNPSPVLVSLRASPHACHSEGRFACLRQAGPRNLLSHCCRRSEQGARNLSAAHHFLLDSNSKYAWRSMPVSFRLIISYATFTEIREHLATVVAQAFSGFSRTKETTLSPFRISSYRRGFCIPLKSAVRKVGEGWAFRVTRQQTLYSYRSASTGSRFAACIAGSHPLITPTTIRIRVDINRVLVESTR